MAIARRTNRFINTKTKQKNMPANLKLELEKPTRTLTNNSPTIIAKDKNMNKLTFIEEANEIFKEIPIIFRAPVLNTS